MDYLDRRKALFHHIVLFTGYILIAIAIVVSALVLLYQAYGFGVTREGDVIQKGLLFFSSQPSPADIYIDNQRNAKQTNTRLDLPAGIYNVKLTRNGYFDWQRPIEVEGGDVKHYDYPFLFPRQLSSQKVQQLAQAPRIFSQSPNKRWLVTQPSANLADFMIYDLDSVEQPPVALVMPDGVLSPPAVGQADNWQAVEWADNNNHLLLKHTFGDQYEYILLDRNEPAKSINLSKTLALNPAELTLKDRKYDKYLAFDPARQTLQSITLKDKVPKQLLQRVVAYKSYGDDTLLYASPTSKRSGLKEVEVWLKTGNDTYKIRDLADGPKYLLDLTEYDGNLYVAAGVSSGSRVYVYKDPAAQRRKQPNQAPSPVQVLHVDQPNYLSFSATAQFVVAENGTRFGVYDFENEIGYNYTTTAPLDPPQTHAEWMDGHRLLYVSGGKLEVFDYDNLNHQTLMQTRGGYSPAFSPDYKYVYTLLGVPSDQFELQRTPLVTASDL